MKFQQRNHTLCWNLSGRGRELKSSSCSAILAPVTFLGLCDSFPVAIRLVSFSFDRDIGDGGGCFSVPCREWRRGLTVSQIRKSHRYCIWERATEATYQFDVVCKFEKEFMVVG